MKRRRESDSSLLIGLILGAVLGAALVTIMTARPEEAPTLSKPNAGSSGASSAEGTVEQASQTLEENDGSRTVGAAEGAR